MAAEARLRPEWVSGPGARARPPPRLPQRLGHVAGEAGRLGLVGIVSTLFVVVALAAAFVVALRAPWARIAVRVAGSWIVAIGLLLLGWSLRAA